MGKFLGILFGLSLIALISVIAWRVYPEEVLQFVPEQLLGINTEEKNQKKSIQDTSVKKNKPLEEKEDHEDLSPKELEDINALLERGKGFLESGLLSLAITDFTNATTLAPDNRTAWSNLIGSQISFRDYSSAESSAKSALIHFPNDQEFLILLGEINMQKSKFTEAKRIFSSLPDGPAKNFYLGVLNAYFEDYDGAKELLGKIANNKEFGDQAQILLGAFDEFSLFPNGNPLHLRLLITKAFNDLHFFEMAIQSSKKIIKEREEYRDAWIILGHSYLSLERYDLAKNILRKALELDPTKPETAFFLGLAETAQEDFDSAITHLSMARENGFIPQAEVTKALAEAFLAGKFYDAARKEYEKLLDVRGAPVEKYIQPIRISLEFLDDPKTAQKMAKMAIENYPDSEVAKNLLAWALLEDGKLGEAREILEEIIAQNPNFAPAHLNLGKVSEQEEKYEEALEHYRIAYDLSPQTEIGTIAAQKYNAIVLQE